jgi:alanine racemase
MNFQRNLSLMPGRPTIAQIDLDALAFNFRQLQKRVPKGVRMLAVVKADAYGHGALPISRKLEKIGVEYLGVAITEEGVELRKGGVRTPILVLGGIYDGDIERIFRFNLTPVIFHREALKSISKVAQRVKKKVKVHLKVDTGMGRLGVPLPLWANFLREMTHFPKVEVEGILSHFSMSEEDYTRHQWDQFLGAVKCAEELGIRCKYLHMASSSALTTSSYYSGNLVRPGILLYGAYPSPVLKNLIHLKPVMTLKTRIHFLKSVPSGFRISYGGTFVTRRESLIATLPIGYADGYSRTLSNRGEVLVRGKRAPVVGKVCMDFIMVDVTDIPKVSLGDEVVLLGIQGKESITAEEIADRINSIAYEVFCSVGKRVPRIYKGQ